MRWFLLLMISASAVWAQSYEYIRPSSATASGYTVWAGTWYTGPAQLAIDGSNVTKWTLKGMGWIEFDLGSPRMIAAVEVSWEGSVSIGNVANVYVDDVLVISNATCYASVNYLALSTPRLGTKIRYETVALPHNEYGQVAQWSEVGEFRAFVSISPLLVAEFPTGTALSDNFAPIAHPATLLSNTSNARVYTVRNSGSAALSDIVVSKSGADSAHFLLTAPTTDSLAPGASTTFSVFFTPTSSGSRTAQLSITSNDTNNSPFVINLSGFGLGEDLDTDGDGLNDAAEFTMSDLGFNWEVAQPSLVNVLYTNANRARLYSELQYSVNRTNGQTDVTTNPAAFNLFTESQYNDNRATGQQDVVASPMAYGLYDSTSIMDLRMGGLMIQKQGTDATIVFQPQTTTDLATLPFTNNGTPITNAVPMPGNKGFLRVGAIYVPSGDLPSGD
jgi:hypothetical protein